MRQWAEVEGSERRMSSKVWLVRKRENMKPTLKGEGGTN